MTIELKGRNYKEIKGMPYVRREFIPGAPQTKIAKFSVGTPSQDYDLKLELRARERAQIRHNAIEAARVAANKKLSEIGEGNYHLLVKIYPHLVLRENKMIATAGADRLQEGMRRAFGKPIGLAARVEIDTLILELNIKRDSLNKAKEAFKVAASKLPIKTYVKEIPLKQVLLEKKR
jgi:large subunit ribosomal protein L10e